MKTFNLCKKNLKNLSHKHELSKLSTQHIASGQVFGRDKYHSQSCPTTTYPGG
jgi:hypothetical protein